MTSTVNPFRETSAAYKAFQLWQKGISRADFITFCEKQDVGHSRLFKNFKDNGYRNVTWQSSISEDGLMKISKIKASASSESSDDVSKKKSKSKKPAPPVAASKPKKLSKLAKEESDQATKRETKVKKAETKVKKAAAASKPASEEAGDKSRAGLPERKIKVLEHTSSFDVPGRDLIGKVFPSFHALSKQTKEGDQSKVKVTSEGKFGYFIVTRKAEGWKIDKAADKAAE